LPHARPPRPKWRNWQRHLTTQHARWIRPHERDRLFFTTTFDQKLFVIPDQRLAPRVVIAANKIGPALLEDLKTELSGRGAIPPQ
jgi:hypothetical protein